MKDANNMMDKEIAEAEEDSCKVIKATLLISGADKQQYGKLKDKLRITIYWAATSTLLPLRR